MKNELKDTDEINVQLCSENTQKTEVKTYILTGKIYLYNKIFSLLHSIKMETPLQSKS